MDCLTYLLPQGLALSRSSDWSAFLKALENFTHSPFSSFVQICLPKDSLCHVPAHYSVLLMHSAVVLIYSVFEFCLVHLCSFHKKVSSVRGELFFFCLVTTISPGVDECLRQRKCLGLNNQRQKLQLKSFLWQYCRKHREGVGRYRKQREGGPKGCVTEVTTGYSRNSKWVWTFWERIGGQPQNNPTEGEGKLGYLLPALNSHWLMFLTGNINVSALLVHPSLYASFRRKPLGRSSQMFKWEMFNVSADYLLEG